MWFYFFSHPLTFRFFFYSLLSLSPSLLHSFSSNFFHSLFPFIHILSLSQYHTLSLSLSYRLSLSFSLIFIFSYFLTHTPSLNLQPLSFHIIISTTFLTYSFFQSFLSPSLFSFKLPFALTLLFLPLSLLLSLYSLAPIFFLFYYSKPEKIILFFSLFSVKIFSGLGRIFHLRSRYSVKFSRFIRNGTLQAIIVPRLLSYLLSPPLRLSSLLSVYVNRHETLSFFLSLFTHSAL